MLHGEQVLTRGRPPDHTIHVYTPTNQMEELYLYTGREGAMGKWLVLGGGFSEW